MCNWQRRDCWALLFWRQWQKSCDCEFLVLHVNAAKEVYPSPLKKEKHWHPQSCLSARWGTTSLLQQKTSALEATLHRRQTSFSPERQSLASILTRLESCWLFSLGLFGRKSVHRQSKDKWRTERKHQKRNQMDSSRDADKSCGQLPRSSCSWYSTTRSMDWTHH